MFIGLTFNVKGDARGDAARDDAEEEFDSPATIAALADAVRGLGHEVELFGDGEPLLRRLLAGRRPDMVFNFAEGTGSGRCRESRVPAVLEMLDIPYSGSDPLTLAVTLDKECAKRLVRDAGGATPQWLLVDEQAVQPERRPRTERQLAALPLPLIVKPAFEGSSKGIFGTNLIHEREQVWPTVFELQREYRQPILVEEFIDGEELTVGMIGNPPEILGIMRVVPRSVDGPFVYSLEVKRDWENRVHYECPARLTERQTEAVRTAARVAWDALGCRDFSRIDFRLRGETPYFLEVNPLPGLNPRSSDLVLMAKAQGIGYAEVVRRIVAAAERRIFGRNA